MGNFTLLLNFCVLVTFCSLIDGWVNFGLAVVRRSSLHKTVYKKFDVLERFKLDSSWTKAQPHKVFPSINKVIGKNKKKKKKVEFVARKQLEKWLSLKGADERIRVNDRTNFISSFPSPDLNSPSFAVFKLLLLATEKSREDKNRSLLFDNQFILFFFLNSLFLL